nr:DUF3265 domain-containing protein [Vibrio parahaemolyticus]
MIFVVKVVCGKLVSAAFTP